MEKRDIIDFSALQKELTHALRADEKYHRENDAKFRAIHQKVASYEEFRDIVLASHLKPLEKKDKNTLRNQPWNPISSVNPLLKHTSTDTLPVTQSALCESQPRSESEFSRDWRRFKGSSVEKYAFLLRLGGETLRQVFHTEVGFGLLGEFLTVLCEHFQPGDEAAVMGVLQGLSLTGRFSLSVSLLSEQERRECECLFHKLLETQHNLADVPESQEKRSTTCEAESQGNTAQEDEDEAARELSSLMAKYGVCKKTEPTNSSL